MARTATCGRAEALGRSRVARMYLDMAELAAGEDLDEARNVAAGNAVLAAIAAADALACLRLGERNRSLRHAAAVDLLNRVSPDGPELAKDLGRVLGIKDPAHYGVVFLAASRIEQTMRCARRLVEAAERALAAG